MVQEDPIELEKKEDLEEKQIQKNNTVVDRAVHCTSKAVDRPYRQAPVDMP